MGVWDDVKQVFDEMTGKEKLYVGVILFVVIAFVVACIIFPISVVILATIVILGIVGFLYTEYKSLDKEVEEDRAYYASDSACVEVCGSYSTKKASYKVYKDDCKFQLWKYVQCDGCQCFFAFSAYDAYSSVDTESAV